MRTGAAAVAVPDAARDNGRPGELFTCRSCRATFAPSVATHAHCSERCARLQLRLRELGNLADRILADIGGRAWIRARWRLRRLVLEAAAGRLAPPSVTHHRTGREQRWCSACGAPCETRRGPGRPPQTCGRRECARARDRASEVARLAAELDDRGRAYLATTATDIAVEIGGRGR